MVHLVTGYAGFEHIQSDDDGAFNASFFGEGQFVMEQGNQFEADVLDNNTVRVLDGNGLMYGRHFRVKPNNYEDLTIATGTAGTNRCDLIVATYEKNTNDGTETAFLEVIKGEESIGTPEAPEYIEGNILEGATKNQMPLYKVHIEGVVLSMIEPIFQTIPTYAALAEKYAAEFLTACEEHLGTLEVLDTLEEIEANTQELQVAGALALKELNESFQDLTSNFQDGVESIIAAINTKSEAAIDDDFYLDGTSTPDEIVNVINNLSSTKIFYLGDAINGSFSVNLKDKLPSDYNTLTATNFLVCPFDSIYYGVYNISDNTAAEYRMRQPVINYNSSTGDLNITEISMDIANWYRNWSNGYENKGGYNKFKYKAKIYVVVGEVIKV